MVLNREQIDLSNQAHQGYFRNAAAGLIKSLIRARTRQEPNFLPAEDYKRWGVTGLESEMRTCAHLLTNVRQLRAQWGLRRRFYNRFLASIESRAVHHLTDNGTSSSCNVPFSTVDHLKINTEEFARSLRALEPDILLVSACPLLKPEIFEIPRLGTINVHRGIAPKYRGERTIFWPLYCQDFKHIGITLHLIDRGIDTGPVLAHGFPELCPDDTEATILAKSVEMAADVMGEMLSEAESGQLHGVRQAGEGRCFYRRDQRIWKDLSYLFLRVMRRRSIPSRSSRVELYSKCEQQLQSASLVD